MKIDPTIQSFVNAMNAQNASAVAACFAPEATVQDEGNEHRGTEAIEAWYSEASRKYQPVMKIQDIAETEKGEAVLTGEVSGDFEGSPATLRYRMLIEGDKIARLKIEA